MQVHQHAYMDSCLKNAIGASSSTASTTSRTLTYSVRADLPKATAVNNPIGEVHLHRSQKAQ